MNIKPYTSFLFIVLCMSACKKEFSTPATGSVEEPLNITIKAKTNYKLIILSDGSDTYNFSYNEQGNVVEIVKSFWVTPRGVAQPYIVKQYTLIKYDEKNRPIWFVKDAMHNDIENLDGADIVYDEGARTVQISSRTTDFKYTFQYDKDAISSSEQQYAGNILHLKYSYKEYNISNILADPDSTGFIAYNVNFKKFDDKKTFIAAIPGINNMLAGYLFDWKDLYNNCLEYSQDLPWQDTSGVRHISHIEGIYSYTYNTDGLPLTRKSVINGKDNGSLIFTYIK